jgi:imidazole glycerol-phosphate synthase subunit HisH
LAPSAPDIVIIDYGMGNLRNVQKAFEHIGVLARISSRPRDVAEADALVLPGVGAFGDAMAHLAQADLIEPICQSVSEGKPLLGICLGLQLLFDESEEMGTYRGLGIIRGRVVRFAPGLKVPHIGWNQLQFAHHQAGSHTAGGTAIGGSAAPRSPSPLLHGIPDGSYAYFVHSYYAVANDPACVLATTDYGLAFASVVQQRNVFGAQPHPEKSQEVGLRLLSNFAAIVERGERR